MDRSPRTNFPLPDLFARRVRRQTGPRASGTSSSVDPPVERPSPTRVVLLLAVLYVMGGTTARAEWQAFSPAEIGANGIYAIVEDPAGRYWVATQNWIRGYDGLGWATYDKERTGGGLRSGYVFAGYRGRDGVLWFGSYHQPGHGYEGGVTKFDWRTNSWERLSPRTGRCDNSITAIAEGLDGSLWCGTLCGGLLRLHGGDWSQFSRAAGQPLPSDTIQVLLGDSRGGLWIGTDKGLARFGEAGWDVPSLSPCLSTTSISVLAIAEDHEGNVWVGTNGYGALRFDGKLWSCFTVENTAGGLVGNSVAAVLADRRGVLWFGTVGNDRSKACVSRFDGQNWQSYAVGDGLPSNDVSVLYQDDLGGIWFGTRANGLARFDDVRSAVYTTDNGLPQPSVRDILQDRSGAYWFATAGAGAASFDGAQWRTLTTSDSLANDVLRAMSEDSAGRLWFSTFGSGVSRYDGTDVRSYGVTDGLGTDDVSDVLGDRLGNVWFAHPLGGGVTRYDSSGTFTTVPGLANTSVSTAFEDREGRLWFGTYGSGAIRYDPLTGARRDIYPGNSDGDISAIDQDPAGALWFGTYSGGVYRYDPLGDAWSPPYRVETVGAAFPSNQVHAIAADDFGRVWIGTTRGAAYLEKDGEWHRVLDIVENGVRAVFEDRVASIWFGVEGLGVVRLDPDRVAPQTVIVSAPRRVSASRFHTATFDAAFGEGQRAPIRYSYSFDGSSWSSWSPIAAWSQAEVPDGKHVLLVRSKDPEGNVDPSPAVVEFEVDGGPPSPLINYPRDGQALRDSIVVRGTASDPRLRRYRLTVAARESTGPGTDSLLAQDSTGVTDGPLAKWDTREFPDGLYELRLDVVDTLQLTGTFRVAVIVDNHAPWADQTSPAVVSAGSGGDVFTTGGDVHLYFPPNALSRDALITIKRYEASSAPPSLPPGATLLDGGYVIDWRTAVLEKKATLSLSLESGRPAGTVPAVYVDRDGSAFVRLGGTWDEHTGRMSLAIDGPGRYAIFSDGGQTAAGAGGDLTGLSFTPRVFSPRGGFAASDVGIGFSLGRPGRVTVRVYDRAGRFVREVLADAPLTAGANLVRWDGRNRDGSVVRDGVYLVSVEALGHRLVKPLAVVK